MSALPENTLVSLHSPAVRDLAWACFAPPLLHTAQLPCTMPVTNCALELTPQRREWLLQLDRQPRALLNHLAERASRRLGLYFEALWHFFLLHDSEVELLAHNLPVRGRKQTLGEYDCIYFCQRRQRAVHLELALKFYLHHRTLACAAQAHENWVGPNTRDRLDLKLQRLLQHQILLSTTPEGARALEQIGATNPLLEIELKGRLFRHIDSRAPAPQAYNPQLPLQHWCRDNEYGDHLQGAKVAILHRQQWLAPVSAASGVTVTVAQPVPTRQAELEDRPFQVAITDAQGNEQGRLFVVPDRWPDDQP
ncbi:DUF1853 family protein [Pseudohalioglobus sediminis]|uniref:DUF1853 family protein n=1 Tax=Pseudohalioglobus sediminis TaxID=2606449 RepID=UPI00165FBCF6|nr:DUF1853 family protein [Pseudohalioglobus sediminis]